MLFLWHKRRRDRYCYEIEGGRIFRGGKITDMKIADAEKAFREYFVIADKFAVRLCFANFFGNSFLPHRDPIWMILLGKSSGGKSTFINPTLAFPNSVPLDDLTEKTLLSGFKAGSKGKDNSLLKQIGQGVMVISDLTPILSKNPQSAGEILSQLRMVHDGNFIKYTGTGKIEWHGKIGLLAASTHEIFYWLEKGRSMGERFSYYEIEPPTDEEVLAMHENSNHSAKEVADIMRGYYEKVWVGLREWVAVKGVTDLVLSAEQTTRINYAASFCVRGKATVHTAFKTGSPNQLPAQAGVGRDIKMFRGILQACQNIDQYEHDDVEYPLADYWIDMIEKMAYSSMNLERRMILEIMANAGGTLTASEIGAHKQLGFEKSSVEEYLTPLCAIGIVTKHPVQPAFKWSLTDKRAVEFVKRVAWGRGTEVVPASKEEVMVSEEINMEGVNFE